MCVVPSHAADYLFSRIPGPEGPAVVVTDDRVESIVPSPVETEEEAARVFFPESWIFQLLKAESVLDLCMHDCVYYWSETLYALLNVKGENNNDCIFLKVND